MPGVTYTAADLHIGSANVYTSPDGTTWTNLGAIDETIELAIEQEKVDLTVGQLGTFVVDRVISGGAARVTMGLKEITLENFKASLAGTNLVIDGTTPTKRRLDFVVKAGLSLRSNSTWLKIVPLDGDVETTDLERVITIPVAIPDADSVSIQYNAQNQQVISVQFTCLPDPTNGNRFMFMGDSTATPTP